MTLADTIYDALTNGKPPNTERHDWAHQLPAEGWTIHLTADRSDSVGCVAWDLTLARSGPPAPGMTTRNWADKIASRVTGLLEPLKIVEVDDAGAEAILRSTTPSRRGAGVSYYEVALAGTAKATVRRFHADPKAGTPRAQVGYALTHEVLAKLVEDVIRD